MKEAHEDLLEIVLEEVGEAHDVRELAQQLVHALPLRSFDDVIKALGEQATITFRGRPLDIRKFALMVPTVVFPVDSPRKLVVLLHEAVKLAPKRTSASRLGVLGAPIGRLGKFGAGVTGSTP
jgi:hypothetical protein